MLYEKPEFSVEREMDKRINRALLDLDQGQRTVFESILSLIRVHMDFDQIDRAAQYKFERDVFSGKHPNHHFFNHEINATIRRVKRRVVQSSTSDWGQDEIESYVMLIIPSLRSICRAIDPLARCFRDLQHGLLALKTA
tara:strand:+ start:1992 stop:2408 length:417 start_codon:yes stop_codon:yes gene_type:complete